jgi:hypothetical protein
MDTALTKMRAGPDRNVHALAPPIWVPQPQPKRIRPMAETPVWGTPMMDEKTAEALLDAQSRNIPIPLKKKEFPTLEETLPEPVLDLKYPKAPSSPRPDPRSVPVPPMPSAARILAEEPMSQAAPVTARGPYAENAPTAPFADVAGVLRAMREAPDRDHVVELLIEGLRPVARKVGIFVVKHGAFVGWACTPELADLDTLRALHVPLGAPTVLARALDAGAPTLGRMDITGPNVTLSAAFRSAPGELAIAAIRIDGKPALVILVDDLGDTTFAMRRLEQLTRAASEALTRILLERRR